MTYVLFVNLIQKSRIISYMVVLVLKLSGMILNCFGSPALKRQLILLSNTLYLVCYQVRAPHLTIFFLLQECIYGTVEETRFFQISTALKRRF